MPIKFLKIVVFVLVFTISACTPKTTEESLKEATELVNQSKYEQAIIKLKNAIQIAPKNITARLDLGRTYFLASQFANAEKELRQAENLQADKNQYFELLLKSIYYQNDFQRAFLLSKDFESEDKALLSTVSLFNYLSYIRDEQNNNPTELPDNLLGDDQLIALGYLSLSDKKPIEAFAFINQFAEPDKETPEKDMLSALANTSLGNVDQAILNYESLIKHFPEYYIARFQLSELLIYSNQLNKAETEVALLYAMNQKGAYANLLLAKINFKRDKFDPALNYAEQAIYNGINSVESNFLAGVSAYKTDKIETAKVYLSKISHSLAPDHVANKILAEINLKLGYTEEALKQMDNFQLSSKNKAAILSNAAIQQFQIGNFLKAKEFINEANQAEPENAQNLLTEGFIKLSSADSSGLDDLAEAINFNASINEAWLLMAETHLKNGNVAQAMDIAKKWQQTNLIEGLSLEGYIYLESNETDKAKTIFTKILSLDPEHTGASRFLMLIKAREGNFSEASELSKKLITADPSRLSTILAFVNISIAQDKVEDAQKYLRALINIDKHNQAPIIANALILSWKKQPVEAIDYLNEMADENNAQVLMIKGDLYKSIGKTAETLKLFDKWTSLYPKESDAWFKKIEFLQTYNKVPEALKATTEALKQFPNEPRLRALNARFLALSGNIDAARKQYDSVKKYESILPTLKLFNGEIALKEKRFTEAKILLSEFYASNPTFSSAQLLAQAMQELGEAKEGGALLEKELLKLKPSLFNSHAIAEYYADNNILDKASSIYLELFQKYPSHYITINNFAAVLVRQGELDKAKELAEVALKLRPKSAYSLDLYGWILFKQDKYAESLIFISKANEILPKNPEIEMHLVEALLKNNQKNQAESILKQVQPITNAHKAYLSGLQKKFAN